LFFLSVVSEIRKFNIIQVLLVLYLLEYKLISVISRFEVDPISEF